jgi:CelD/BcsL family acetyltransferase involved in cellulose biosynthesis
MSLETHVVANQGEFEALGPEWDALVLASRRPTPFLLQPWLSAWWSHYRPDALMRCIVVRADGRLVGALPLAIVRRRGVRVGEMAGALALADALVAGADPKPVVTALAAAIRRQPLDLVDFDYLAPDCLLARWLPGRRRVTPTRAAPMMEMPDGWQEAYKRATSSKTRNTHKRRLKQLAKHGDVRFVRNETEPDVARALEDAFRLHALRWKDRRDLSPLGDAGGQAYNREALAALSRKGYVRLIELQLDGVPIAFHLYLLLAETMFVYRLAFDPAYAQYSPGLLTTLEALRQGSDEGARRVEFLVGDERYKRELADHVDPLMRVVGLPSSARGRAYMELIAADTALRTRLRRHERLRRVVRQVRRLPQV